MNYQFFGTAGIFSGVLWLAALVMCFLIISDVCYWYDDIFTLIAWICFLLPIAFWLVVGVLCGLNALWGWGLVA